MTIQHYTVRSNRQRQRIWIEGARLLSAGFTYHMPYVVEIVGNSLVLKRCAQGARKVTGAPARPIIDITGKSCAPFDTGDAVEITYMAGVIMISPEGK